MNASSDPFWVIALITVLVAALYFGPLPIMVRGFIRYIAGPRHVHRWFRAASLGVALGAVLAAVLLGERNANQTLAVVLTCLVLLLAIIDWQWRWLPIEWTLALVIVGLIHGLIVDDLMLVVMQIFVPSMVLLVLRQAISTAMKKEALGFGDIWLVAGLGAFLPIFGTFFVIGIAALSGLIETILRSAFKRNMRNFASVSYGTHLCVVFLILRSFPQIL